MKQRLLDLYLNNKSTFTQKLKSKENSDLYSWFLEQTKDITELTIKNTAYIFLFAPDLSCKYGNSKKLSQGKVRLCGANKSCQCFVDSLNENRSVGFWNSNSEKEKFLETRKENWLSKYGVENPLLLKENKEKRLVAMNKLNRHKLQADKQDAGYNQVINRVKEYAIPLFTVDNYNGTFRKNIYPWQCVKCNNKFDYNLDYSKFLKCPKCHPKSRSMIEEGISQFLTDTNVDHVTNTKELIPPREIDIWIPSRHIAIECNGVYWHSTIHKSDPNYHLSKYLECRDKGIHLIHIFDVDWNNKKDIIKARLLNLFGKGEKTFARKTQLEVISSSVAKDFCNKFHLAGWATSSINYGLYTDNTLKAVMTFSKPRYNKDEQYELIRYCSDGQVIGGASKLFARFVKDYDPDSVISYADRCWSNGNLYMQLNFQKIDNDTGTGYFYADRNRRYSTAIAEKEMLKVYDCGNHKFFWKRVDLK